MREIVNSDLIGSMTEITLPGFDGEGEHVPIHYFEAGEGEPLLLVHSPGQSLYTFRRLLPLLSKKYRCIAPDLPGSGFSGRPVSLNYSMREMGESLLLFLDALGIGRMCAAGASLGGLYLLEAAKAAPEKFRKLVFFCPGGVTKNMPHPLRMMGLPVLGPAARELYTRTSYAKALRTAYYDSTLCTETVVSEYFRSADDYASRQALMYALRNFDAPHAFRKADKLDQDIFLLWGAADRWQPPVNMNFALDAMPLAYHFEIENAGHFFWEEKAEQTADRMDKFFQYVREEEC